MLPPAASRLFVLARPERNCGRWKWNSFTLSRTFVLYKYAKSRTRVPQRRPTLPEEEFLLCADMPGPGVIWAAAGCSNWLAGRIAGISVGDSLFCPAWQRGKYMCQDAHHAVMVRASQ